MKTISDLYFQNIVLTAFAVLLRITLPKKTLWIMSTRFHLLDLAKKEECGPWGWWWRQRARQLLGQALAATERPLRAAARPSAPQTQQAQREGSGAASRTPVPNEGPEETSGWLWWRVFVPSVEVLSHNAAWYPKLPHFWTVHRITHLDLEAARSRIKSLMGEGKTRAVMLMGTIN